MRYIKTAEGSLQSEEDVVQKQDYSLGYLEDRKVELETELAKINLLLGEATKLGIKKIPVDVPAEEIII